MKPGAPWSSFLLTKVSSDLSVCCIPPRYKESKIGLRWRTQAEVVSGKGQFSCGAKGCDSSVGLCAFEVNFAYQEAGQAKQALVKLCLCEECAYRLNYRREKGKQYKNLGSSTAFDRQQQQQQQERQQQERRRDRPEGRGQQRMHEEERDGEQGRRRDRHRPRDRAGAPLPPPPEEQQQQREYDRGTWQGRDRDRVRDAGRSSDSSSGRGCKEHQPGAELRLEVQRPQHVQQEGERQQPQAVPVQLQADAHVEQQRPSSGRKRQLTPATDDTSEQQGGIEGSSRQSKHARAEQSPAAQLKGPAAVAAAAVRAAAAAAADSVLNGAGQAAVPERWQLDRQGPSATAFQAEASVEPATSCGPDRWELADGELDDADIERWLDSLFTAVPT